MGRDAQRPTACSRGTIGPIRRSRVAVPAVATHLPPALCADTSAVGAPTPTANCTDDGGPRSPTSAMTGRKTPKQGAPRRVWLFAAPRCHPEQSTATSRAAQMARIRVSASRPSRRTSTATETLSTESRFTAERRGIGSESGSRTTSLASPRMIVVHGATSGRRSRGIATSRDSTTTGRQPISASSHHHTSPRAGSALTRRQPPAATTPGRPTRRAHQPGARRRRRNSHRSPPIDNERVMLRELHR
jgi:hypothetical protein